MTRLLLFLGALALSLRLGFVFETAALPSFRSLIPILDANLFWQAAIQLRDGGAGPIFETQIPSTPLFPSLLATTQSILGESILHHRILFATIGTLTVLISSQITWLLTGNRLAAGITGILLAFLPSGIYFSTVILKPVVELFLLALSLLLTFCFLKSRKLNTSLRLTLLFGLAVGLLLGMMILSQLSTAPFGIAIALSVFFSREAPLRDKSIFSAVILLCSLMTFFTFQQRVGPFADLKDTYVPQSGIHLRVGFQEHASGYYTKVPGIPNNPIGHTYYGRIVAEGETGQRLTFSEANSFHSRKAYQFIRENPGNSLKLIARKLFLALNNFEIKGNDYLEQLREDSSLLRWSPINFGLIFLLASLGALSLINSRQYVTAILLLGITASVLTTVAATFVTWRYRIHMIVPLSILAGIGVAYMKEQVLIFLNQRNLPQLTTALLLPLLLIGTFTFFPPGVNRQQFLGKARGNNQLAIRSEKLEHDFAQLPEKEKQGQDVGLVRAQILRNLYRHSEAFRETKKNLIRHPSDVRTHFDYAMYLLWLGEYRLCAEHLSQLRANDSALFKKVYEALARGAAIEKVMKLFVEPEL